ncbi:hypothetical protein Tco_1166725 [Tanacetum coccineum]
MMESSIEVTDQGDFWNDQQDWEIVTWRLYETCGVCILEFKDGTCLSTCSLKDIYSSIQGIACKGLMLNFGLEVEVESTATLDLIRHKNWLIHKQMACGKDFSNPFLVDNLPKIVGFSTHLASWLRDNVARRIAKDVKGNFKINEQDLSVCSESIQQPEKKARARQDRGGRAGQLVRVNVDEGRSQTAPVRQAAGAASRIQPHASVLATQQLNKVGLTRSGLHPVRTVVVASKFSRSHSDICITRYLLTGRWNVFALLRARQIWGTKLAVVGVTEVIQRGNGPVSVSTDTNGVIKVLPPKTAEEILARERERKARTTLLMALPEDHLAKFHKMTDAKEMWEAIKSRFGGNDESKKMQKYILKQQFEGFSVSNSEGLHKGYDRFQSLLSQLEIHGASISTKRCKSEVP